MDKHAPEPERLVSCLCVTESRAAFMPWLLWCFDRQTWRRKELLIFDSSPEPFQPVGREDVRLVTLPPGTSVPRKRNLALRQAAGELIAWFDDDDWQHPERIRLLVEALSNGAACAGAQRAWFVDLATRRCQAYPGFKGRVVFNGAMFRADAVRQIAFPEHQHSGSDTPWVTALTAREPGRVVLLERQDLFFWLCHATNLSNPTHRRQFPEKLERLRAVIGDAAWGDTDTALDELQARVGSSKPESQTARPARRRTLTRPMEPAPEDAGPAPIQSTDRIPELAPPVGVMIKATVLDAPYLDTMVRHMLAQARYEFGERVIVVDRRTNFLGKYRNRPRPDQSELDRTLARLIDDGVVDTIRDVDMHPARVQEITQRYFSDQAEHVPTHASTGGPIYATLFGLEAMRCDYVLQMDADVFFHTGPQGWVRRSLELLQADHRLWLMMAHPGPPAGPPGLSLGQVNNQNANWDEALQLWRFRTATTRYFLCDRRRLRGQLKPILRADGCAPLENCISLALQRQGAFRGALGDLQSWHLHAWCHGDPFPEWVLPLARLVEAGCFPALQRGQYDLRLDLEAPRRQWGALVAGLQSGSGDTAPGRPSELPRIPERVASARRPEDASAAAQPTGQAPIAVIIPVRNRAGQRLRNALASLNWQSSGRPAQVSVVSHGSLPEVDRELQAICDDRGAGLITLGNSSQPWNKSLALNAGILRTLPELPFVLTMDADMILAPNFLAAVLERLRRQPASLILCRASDLPQQTAVPGDPTELQAAFEPLRLLSRLRPSYGCGGIQAARRAFYFEIRGYDEDLLWWGAMDGDILNRAKAMHLELAWIENVTAMLHQWHPRKQASLTDPHQIEEARRYWQANHQLVRQRAQAPVRNSRGWGGVVG